MHYYKFNISDWALGTAHLSLIEEAIYFRLINHYYDTEKPIPEETHSVVRRLRLGSESDSVQIILDEFFTLTDKGYVNYRCEEILKDYRKTSKKNKQNGSKGGRPSKNAAPKETQEEPSGLISVSQNNPNQEPLTTNQEILTTNQKPIAKINEKNKTTKKTSVVDSVDYSPLNISDCQIDEILKIRLKNCLTSKKAKLTQRSINTLANEFNKAYMAGHDIEAILNEWDIRGWQAFKAEWMKPKIYNKNQPIQHESTRTRDQSVNKQLIDNSWAN